MQLFVRMCVCVCCLAGLLPLMPLFTPHTPTHPPTQSHNHLPTRPLLPPRSNHHHPLGDCQQAAVTVAAAVGIAPSDVHAGIKPAGKAALVDQLRASGHRVAMVGDGINDTAALAAADVGMAMAGGVDAASDVAKVVLMGDQLHQVCVCVSVQRAQLGKSLPRSLLCGTV